MCHRSREEAWTVDTLYDHSDSKETTSDSRASDVSGAFEHLNFLKKNLVSHLSSDSLWTSQGSGMPWHQLGPSSVSSFDFA